MGTTLHRGVRASHYRGLSRCGAQAPDAQAQQLWLTGPVAPQHAGSSQTRARTRVPCVGRQTLNHCATTEALQSIFLKIMSFDILVPIIQIQVKHYQKDSPSFIKYLLFYDYFVSKYYSFSLPPPKEIVVNKLSPATLQLNCFLQLISGLDL